MAITNESFWVGTKFHSNTIRRILYEWKAERKSCQISYKIDRGWGVRNCIPYTVYSRRMINISVAPLHDDVIKWKPFPRYWPFVRGIHRSPLTSPHKGQWRGALIISSICAWINSWVNNHEAGDLRRHRVHYDLTVMVMQLLWYIYVYIYICDFKPLNRLAMILHHSRINYCVLYVTAIVTASYCNNRVVIINGLWSITGVNVVPLSSCHVFLFLRNHA